MTLEILNAMEVTDALRMMGQGMLGIFVVIGAIAGIVALFVKFSSGKK